MHWRFSFIVAATLGIAVSAPRAQGDRPPERTWTLGRETTKTVGGASGFARSASTVTVVYTEQYKKTAAGYDDWVAGPRRVVWSARSEERSFNHVHMARETPGAMPTRTRADSTESCA